MQNTLFPVKYTIGPGERYPGYKYRIYWCPKGWGEQRWHPTEIWYDSYFLAKLYCWRANRRFWK